MADVYPFQQGSTLRSQAQGGAQSVRPTASPGRQPNGGCIETCLLRQLFASVRTSHFYAFHGVFHEISPDLMIQTFEYEGLGEPGHVSLESLKLEPLPGNRTRLTIHTIFLSVADRDGMVQSDMERGVREGYERLDEMVETLQMAQKAD